MRITVTFQMYSCVTDHRMFIWVYLDYVIHDRITGTLEKWYTIIFKMYGIPDNTVFMTKIYL